MTFLEYVCRRLMGPPVSGSCWRCPFCDSSGPSFSVRPPKPGYPVKFKCFRCGEWGDEYDLMKLCHPNGGFSERRNRLDQWRQDYERDTPILHRGPGSTQTVNQQPHIHCDEPGNVELAWANLIGELRDEVTGEAFALQLLNRVKEHCDQNHVSMEALLAYWNDFERWAVESEERHRAECDDPDCDARVCRIARGLAPLTPEEIEADRQERLAAKQRSREQVRRALRSARNGRG
jgi:hypothetical protein